VAPGALVLSSRRSEFESPGARGDREAVREIRRIDLGRLMIKDPARMDDRALRVQEETVMHARTSVVPCGRIRIALTSRLRFL